jgi:lipid-binding SYLF domain-containing protein
MYTRTTFLRALGIALLACAGCSTVPPTESARRSLERDAEYTVERFKTTDPSLDRFFNRAAGYAVFPSIGKGGFWFAGGYGRGIFYERDQSGVKQTGYADVTMGTFGPQIGAQAYSQIVFFENVDAVNNFKFGTLKLAASVSAVAATAGAASNAAYADRVAVFTLAQAGLMAEVSVGGQSFSFRPN